MVKRLPLICQQIIGSLGTRQCYICDQESNELVCDYCLHDTDFAHFPVPGMDLLELEFISKRLLSINYNNLRAIAYHHGILASLINQLKFSQKPLVADILGTFFETYVLHRLSQLEALPEALMPMPISSWRFMQRQYNQSWLLAKAINRYHKIPIIQPVIRHRHTKQQSRLSREQRLANTNDAFSLREPIKVQHIGIVEDVITTGASMYNLCECIRSHTPDIKISVWCMAVTKVE
ncbi:ComF family protein [Agaribacter flavus]|uniref:ComF family protein n=1 Tax=Agaribacter flavus TaxID=1902781 RepID=A0ABV7FVU9_9ALTE